MTKRSLSALLFAAFLSVFVVSCGKDSSSKSSDKPSSESAGDKSSSSSSGESSGDKSSSSTESSGDKSSSSGSSELNSEAGKFAVKLPDGYSEPKQSTKPVATAVGSVDMIMYQSSKDDDHLCMIAYSDYPKDAVSKGDPDKLLDAAMDGSVNSMSAKVISKENIKLDGYPGRSFRFTMTTGGKSGSGQFNTYFVSPRLYQVCYLTTDGAEGLDDEDIKAYFSSFHLKK